MNKSISELLRKASSCIARKEYAVAIELYSEVLSKYPKNTKALRGLSQAKKHHLEKVQFSPTPTEIIKDLQIMVREKRLKEVIKKANDLTKLYPKSMALWNIIGEAYFESSNYKKAIDAYNKSISILPDFADNYVALSRVLFADNQIIDAQSAIETALMLAPNNKRALQQAFFILERTNNLEKVSELVDKLTSLFPESPGVTFLEALYLWRNGQKKEACSTLFSIDKKVSNVLENAGYLNLKAKCHEYLKDYYKAFESFDKQNQYMKKNNADVVEAGDAYFIKAQQRLKHLKSKRGSNSQSLQKSVVDVKIAFLVGFPRSGTTLLDTILRSHSEISVIEERPMTVKALGHVKASGYDHLHDFNLPRPIRVEAASIYLDALKSEVGDIDKGITYVDKLPLNLINAPVISSIFPNAKFILALRHPMDTVFSSWMQNFQLNAAMACMLDLNRAAELYCTAMDIFNTCREIRKLDVCEVRYENIIQDLKGEVSNALSLLGVEWQESMNDYQKTALKRDNIRTPSYSQVIQPLYQEANQRWRNYEKYLQDPLKTLQPWIEKYGYAR